MHNPKDKKNNITNNLLSAYHDDSHRYVRDKYVTECGYNLLSAYHDDSHRYVRDKYVTECGYNLVKIGRAHVWTPVTS